MEYRVIFFIQLAAVFTAGLGLGSGSELVRICTGLAGCMGVGAFLYDAWTFASERDRKLRSEKIERMLGFGP